MIPIDNFRGITFQPPGGHPLPWLLLVALLIGYAVWVYRQNPAPLSRGMRSLLRGLRGLAFALLLLLICRPMVTLGAGPQGRRWVALLLDTSESLSLPAGSGPDGPTRAARAREAVTALLPGLRDRYTVRAYGFDGAARPLPDDPKTLAASAAARPGGDVTALGPAIDTAVGEIGRVRTGAVVIVSDGVANHGLDPMSVARRLALPVYAVGVGSDSVAADAAVARLKVNRTAFLGDEVPLAVTVSNAGLAGRSTELEVIDVTRPEAPQPVTRQALTWAEGGAEQEIRLRFRPAVVGLHFYEVRLPGMPGELTAVNNRRLFALEVREEKSRVLLACGRLTWETTFLTRVLNADSSLSVTAMARLGGGWRRLDQPTVAAEFPADPARLGRYALVVLMDLEARDLPEDAWGELAAWTRRGGGLLVFGGAGGVRRLSGTAIAPLLPVDPVTARGNGSDGVAPILTAAGRRHPVTMVDESEAANADLWRDLPPLVAPSASPVLAGGAEVLAAGAGADDYPVLVAGRSATGKVLLAPASGYWKWAFRLRGYSEKAGFYDRLWTGAVRWLTSPDLANRLLVEPGQPVFERGDAVDFSARLADREYQPVEGAEISVTVTADSLPSRTFTLTGSGGGFYAGETASLPPGRYRYRAEAGLSGARLGEASGVFAVEAMGVEFRRPAADLALLRRLAGDTGGRLYLPEQAGRLPGEISMPGAASEDVVTLDVWDSPWFFVAFLALLSLEWFLRRRRGMV